jgi:hypothetical protein
MDPRIERISMNDADTAREWTRQWMRNGTIHPDPELTSPRQLPELRMTLLDRWRPGGDYHLAAEVVNAQPRLVGKEQYLPYAPRFDGYALSQAELWWVTSDMTDLVEHAAVTLPPTTLTDDLVPHDYGLAYFARPLLGTDADGSGNPVAVHMMLWGPTNIRQDGPNVPDELEPFVEAPRHKALTISCYGYPLAMSEGPWISQGRSDWLWDTDTEAPSIDGVDDVRRQSMSEDRRWLAALWLLAAQPLSETTTTSADRPARRRLGRAHPSAPRRLTDPEVRLVDLRRPKRPPEPPGRDGGARRRWSVRTIVRGHWRQQAYGPGWTLHRPVYIAEHIAGPDNAPLIVPGDRARRARRPAVSEEEAIVCCIPVDELSHPTAESEIGQCEQCQRDVWLDLGLHEELRGYRLIVRCRQCARLDDEPVEMAVTAGQVRRLRAQGTPDHVIAALLTVAEVAGPTGDFLAAWTRIKASPRSDEARRFREALERARAFVAMS